MNSVRTITGLELEQDIQCDTIEITSILSFDNITFENSFKLSILTLTNTVSSNMFGIMDLNFYDLNTISKSTLMVFMIVGKIEFIAILFLIKNFFLRE